MVCMVLDKFAVAGMNAEFRRGQREDQPAFPRINRLEPEYVTKKNAIRFRIATIEEKMYAINHDGRDSNA